MVRFMLRKFYCQTSLVRPPIANIEQVVVVVAVQDPEPNQMLIDGILAMAEAEA